jgi:hypothetical protein
MTRTPLPLGPRNDSARGWYGYVIARWELFRQRVTGGDSARAYELAWHEAVHFMRLRRGLSEASAVAALALVGITPPAATKSELTGDTSSQALHNVSTYRRARGNRWPPFIASSIAKPRRAAS